MRAAAPVAGGADAAVAIGVGVPVAGGAGGGAAIGAGLATGEAGIAAAGARIGLFGGMAGMAVVSTVLFVGYYLYRLSTRANANAELLNQMFRCPLTN